MAFLRLNPILPFLQPSEQEKRDNMSMLIAQNVSPSGEGLGEGIGDDLVFIKV